jgi:hypothetical protein
MIQTLYAHMNKIKIKKKKEKKNNGFWPRPLRLEMITIYNEPQY